MYNLFTSLFSKINSGLQANIHFVKRNWSWKHFSIFLLNIGVGGMSRVVLSSNKKFLKRDKLLAQESDIISSIVITPLNNYNPPQTLCDNKDNINFTYVAEKNSDVSAPVNFNERSDINSDKVFPVKIYGLFRYGKISPEHLRLYKVPCSSNRFIKVDKAKISSRQECLAIIASYRAEVKRQSQPWESFKDYILHNNFLQIVFPTEGGIRKLSHPTPFCGYSKLKKNDIHGINMAFPIDKPWFKETYYVKKEGTPGVIPGVPYEKHVISMYKDVSYTMYCQNENGVIVGITLRFSHRTSRRARRYLQNQLIASANIGPPFDWKPTFNRKINNLIRRPGQLYLSNYFEVIPASKEAAGRQDHFTLIKLNNGHYMGAFIHSFKNGTSGERVWEIKAEFTGSDRQHIITNAEIEPIINQKVFITNNRLEEFILRGETLINWTYLVVNATVSPVVSTKLSFPKGVRAFDIKEYKGRFYILARCNDGNLYLRLSGKPLIKINDNDIVKGAIHSNIISKYSVPNFYDYDLIFIYFSLKFGLSVKRMNLAANILGKRFSLKAFGGRYENTNFDAPLKSISSQPISFFHNGIGEVIERLEILLHDEDGNVLLASYPLDFTKPEIINKKENSIDILGLLEIMLSCFILGVGILSCIMSCWFIDVEITRQRNSKKHRTLQNNATIFEENSSSFEESDETESSTGESSSSSGYEDNSNLSTTTSGEGETDSSYEDNSSSNYSV